MYQYGCGFPTLRSARSFLAAHNLRQLIDVNYSCSRATTILAEPEQVDGTPGDHGAVLGVGVSGRRVKGNCRWGME